MRHRLMCTVVTHIQPEDVETLLECFAVMTEQGWQAPEWLMEMAVRAGLFKELSQ